MGYNNTTPIMVVTDKKYIVKKVALLSHHETFGYVCRLERMVFLVTGTISN